MSFPFEHPLQTTQSQQTSRNFILSNPVTAVPDDVTPTYQPQQSSISVVATSVIENPPQFSGISSAEHTQLFKSTSITHNTISLSTSTHASTSELFYAVNREIAHHHTSPVNISDNSRLFVRPHSPVSPSLTAIQYCRPPPPTYAEISNLAAQYSATSMHDNSATRQPMASGAVIHSRGQPLPMRGTSVKMRLGAAKRPSHLFDPSYKTSIQSGKSHLIAQVGNISDSSGAVTGPYHAEQHYLLPSSGSVGAENAMLFEEDFHPSQQQQFYGSAGQPETDYHTQQATYDVDQQVIEQTMPPFISNFGTSQQQQQFYSDSPAASSSSHTSTAPGSSGSADMLHHHMQRPQFGSQQQLQYVQPNIKPNLMSPEIDARPSSNSSSSQMTLGQINISSGESENMGGGGPYYIPASDSSRQQSYVDHQHYPVHQQQQPYEMHSGAPRQQQQSFGRMENIGDEIDGRLIRANEQPRFEQLTVDQLLTSQQQSQQSYAIYGTHPPVSSSFW